jgi:hypothetical protein
MMCFHIEPLITESLFTTDRILVIIAIVVSLFALIFSFLYNRKTLILTKDHNKKMVTPTLVLNRGFNSYKTFNFSCNIKNAGFGPATITDIKFEYNGKSYKDFNDLFSKEVKMYLFMINHDKTKSSKLDEREVLAPNGEEHLYFIEIKNREYFNTLEEILRKTVATINYECIYGNKYMYKKIVNTF